MSDFWEPWTPQIGQRVRVLPRPECFYCREEGEQEVGLIGQVTDIEFTPWPIDEKGAPAHRYWVTFDDRAATDCGMNHFAAGELEPVP